MLKDKSLVKQTRKLKLRKRLREKIGGLPERPRLHVFKSNRYVYAQAIDDLSGRVLASASTLEKAFKEISANKKNKKACELLGDLLARRLKANKIQKIVFDRGVYPYHGRIKNIAEALRKQSIQF